MNEAKTLRTELNRVLGTEVPNGHIHAVMEEFIKLLSRCPDGALTQHLDEPTDPDAR